MSGEVSREEAGRFTQPPRPDHWNVDELPWESLEADRIVDNEVFFFLVSTASFVEITTDLYTSNLTAHYVGDDEVTTWLHDHWQPEELQHGAALKRYVETVWPSFDWDLAYQNFYREYGRLCNATQLEATRSQEMVARCIVETGTSSYYTMVRDASPEPLLKRIAHHIRTDEVGHYKYFFRYFRKYAQQESVSRRAILKALWTRIREIDSEDGLIAYKHAYQVRYPDRVFDPEHYEQFRMILNQMTRDHFPFEMAVRMCLRPLELPHPVERVSIPILVAGARRFL